MELPPRYKISEGQKANPHFGEADKNGHVDMRPAIPKGKKDQEPKTEPDAE